LSRDGRREHADHRYREAGHQRRGRWDLRRPERRRAAP